MEQRLAAPKPAQKFSSGKSLPILVNDTFVRSSLPQHVSSKSVLLLKWCTEETGNKRGRQEDRGKKGMKIKAILGKGKARVVSWGRGSGAQSKSVYYHVALAERHWEGFAESISSRGRKREEKDWKDVWQLGKSLPLFLPSGLVGFWKGCWRKGFQQGSGSNFLLKPNSGQGLQERNSISNQEHKNWLLLTGGGGRAELTLQCLLAEKFPSWDGTISPVPTGAFPFACWSPCSSRCTVSPSPELEPLCNKGHSEHTTYGNGTWGQPAFPSWSWGFYSITHFVSDSSVITKAAPGSALFTSVLWNVWIYFNGKNYGHHSVPDTSGMSPKDVFIPTVEKVCSERHLGPSIPMRLIAVDIIIAWLSISILKIVQWPWSFPSLACMVLLNP